MKVGKFLLAVGLVVAAGAAAVVAVGPVQQKLDLKTVSNDQAVTANNAKQADKGAKDVVRFQLAPSADLFKKCLPHAKVEISVALRTDATGRDVLRIDGTGLPPKTSFTAFLLEQPANPFGAAEYFGDLNTDKYGNGHAEFELIVQEAFSSTLVNGKRVRVELNHVGMWFADPTGDDICFGKGGGPVTPFDGDNEAGAQVFNSANSLPGAPLP